MRNTDKKEKFALEFFKIYDKKIFSGEITFKETGISKNDFTKLCTDSDFSLDLETIETIRVTMKLDDEQYERLRKLAEEKRTTY